MRLMLKELTVSLRYCARTDSILFRWYAGDSRIPPGYLVENASWHWVKARTPEGVLVTYRAR